jgi:hypothetical protein
MRFAKLMLVLLFFAFVVNAENWPQFRGPNASGKADGNNIPESWNIESKQIFCGPLKFPE